MRAVAEADHGGPEVLTVTDQPVPELTADGILGLYDMLVDISEIKSRHGALVVKKSGGSV